MLWFKKLCFVGLCSFTVQLSLSIQYNIKDESDIWHHTLNLYSQWYYIFRSPVVMDDVWRQSINITVTTSIFAFQNKAIA